ncbi:unnamed protein product [Caenorhabditis angaria]|uniref:Uncharacterized protein n=1 Tax=Caenorhabditis angaria TaxID=860376 RepID=A0A9P1J425_9PELO|nr:unnamed protein product [Caenorhabditis angaria]
MTYDNFFFYYCHTTCNSNYIIRSITSSTTWNIEMQSIFQMFKATSALGPEEISVENKNVFTHDNNQNSYYLKFGEHQFSCFSKGLIGMNLNEFISEYKSVDHIRIAILNGNADELLKQLQPKNLIIRHNILKRRMMFVNFSNNVLNIRNLLAYSEY